MVIGCTSLRPLSPFVLSSVTRAFDVLPSRTSCTSSHVIRDGLCSLQYHPHNTKTLHDRQFAEHISLANGKLQKNLLIQKVMLFLETLYRCNCVLQNTARTFTIFFFSKFTHSTRLRFLKFNCCAQAEYHEWLYCACKIISKKLNPMKLT